MRAIPVSLWMSLVLVVSCGEKPDDTDSPVEGDTDADADADTDADTDSDADGDTDPDPEGDCGDGLDNDGDGLVDCEDGDCSDDERCSEACDDGLDNDADGLVDCEDDECWGASCHPAGVRARVHGGHLWTDRDEIMTGQWSHLGPYGWWSYGAEVQQQGMMSGIQGTVQVLPPGESSWLQAERRTTCSWSVASGSVSNSASAFGLEMNGTFDYATEVPLEPWQLQPLTIALGVPERRGFVLEEGCRLGGSWFLPPYLLLEEQGQVWRVDTLGTSAGYPDMRLGSLWYAGAAITSTSSTSQLAPDWSAPGSWRYQHRVQLEAELATTPPAYNLEQATVLEDYASENRLGTTVSGGWDWNADGHDDFAVWGVLQGIHVFFGPVDPDLAMGDEALLIDVPHDDYGGDGPVISGGLDVDGDGLGDLLVGGADTSYGGEVYLYLGADDGSLCGVLGPPQAWATYAGAGVDHWGVGFSGALSPDLDGDGLADLLVGSYDGMSSGEGSVYLVTGLTAGEHALDDSYAARIGSSSGDDVGFALAALGDLDGDGLGEVAVGAGGSDLGGDGAGLVAVFASTVTGDQDISAGDALILGDREDARAGRQLASPGDMDGDGYADLVLAAGGTEGGAFLFSGPLTGTVLLSEAETRFVSICGEPTSALLPTAAGDVDQDGHADLLLQEHHTDCRWLTQWTGWSATPLYLLLGPSSGTVSMDEAALTLTREFEGEDDGGPTAFSVSAGGDLNDDGWGDILVGARYMRPHGSAHLWFFEP